MYTSISVAASAMRLNNKRIPSLIENLGDGAGAVRSALV